MNIKQVEEITGITRQNIRFYEKQGLVHPARNKDNEYREYTQEDIEQLKMVKLLRKLQMPIEQILKVSAGEIELPRAIAEHRRQLETEKEQLAAAIEFCRQMEKDKVKNTDIEACLTRLEQEERGGHTFMNIVNDFKLLEKAERKRQFSFSPDTMIRNSKEFTDALFAYAHENTKDIVITKEGMYPEFTMDGLEYEAERQFCRFGAVVICRMKYPEQAEEGNIPDRRRRMYRFAVWTFLPLCIFVYLLVVSMDSGSSPAVATAFAVVLTAGLASCYRFFPKN